MKIGSSLASLTLNRIEFDAIGIRASVSVIADGFAGDNEVWFDSQSATEFIAALDQLDASRIGLVTIQAMSPDDCTLQISSIDRFGHLSIDATISRVVFLGTIVRRNQCRVIFEFDGGRFRELIDGLREELFPSEKLAE